MRREGRPHGMVRTVYILPEPLNPRPASRIFNKVDSPPTAGVFSKHPNKPSNHSKFTGKCERPRCSGCHIHPPGKAKDKSKGTQKIRSSDAALNYKSITWTVNGDDAKNLPRVGYSASRMLDELDCGDNISGSFDDNDSDHSDDCDSLDYEYGNDHDEEEEEDEESSGMVGIIDVDTTAVVEACGDREDDIVIHAGVTADGDNGYVGFYDVAGVWNAVDDDEDDDEGWSLVGGEL